MLVGHVAGLGHGRGDLDRVAQHMDVFDRHRLKGQKIDFAPALVGRGQAGFDRNVASAHGRDVIDHRGFDVVVEIKLEGVGGGVHIDHLVARAVFNDALVAIGPGFFEQGAFGGDVFVLVQDQHLALGFGLAEVMRHLASPLVGARGAAVWGQGHIHGKHTAVGHGLQLLAQGQGLRARLPRMQNLVGRAGLGHARGAARHEVHTRRHDQAVVGQGCARGQGDDAFVGINLGDEVLHHLDTVAARQIVVGRGDVGHGFAATDHQVGNGARHKSRIGLDQGHINAVV